MSRRHNKIRNFSYSAEKKRKEEKKVKYRKIVLKTKGYHLTEYQSDTILGYIFWVNYEKLKDLYERYKKDPSFLISNWFLEGYVPKPLRDKEDKDKKEGFRNPREENEKKVKRKIQFVPIKDAISLYENQKEIKIDKEIEKLVEKEEVWKLSLEWGEINLFMESGKKYNKNIHIYVKIYENGDEDFNIFFKALQETFLKIWFWKAKSRGYGKFDEVREEKVSADESLFLEYIDKEKKKKNFFILNNYKPSENEIQNLDRRRSRIKNLVKYPTTYFDRDKNNWSKGKITFIEPGSFIKSEILLKGDSYERGNSVNFWYIF